MNRDNPKGSPLSAAQLEDMRVAIYLSGGARAVAQKMGYRTGESVRRFYAGEKEVPAELCMAMRKAVDCRLTLQQIRPDLYRGLTVDQLGYAPRAARRAATTAEAARA